MQPWARWILNFFVAIGSAACTSSTGTTTHLGTTYHSAQTTGAVASPTGPAPGGWQANETIGVMEAMPIVDIPAIRYRAGTAPDGLPYRIYADGSGSVGHINEKPSWSIDCKKDAMTDKRNCSVSASEPPLFVSFSEQSPVWVCIVGHDFPGRTGAIRIDGGTPMSTDKDGCVPGSVAARLSKSKTVALRYVHWPYSYDRDVAGDLTGLSSALDLARFIYLRIDQLQF